MDSINEMRIIMDSIENIMESPADGVWYHGTPHKIKNFVDDFVGTGNDEFGPGIYFGDSPRIAVQYTGDDNGYIYVADIHLRKLLQPGSRINQAVIKKFILDSPDEDAYTNWSDDINEAIRESMKVYLGIGDMYDVLMYILNDWYHDYKLDFVRELVKCGYDGTLHKFRDGQFLVVYNPACIKITDVVSAKNASSLNK